jgi:hypothetical protein
VFNKVSVDAFDFIFAEPVLESKINHGHDFSENIVKVFVFGRKSLYFAFDVYFVSCELNLMDFEFFQLINQGIHFAL